MDAHDLSFMRLALLEAQKAETHDDIPVGAVVVKDGLVLGLGRNERERLGSPTAHAEIQAINAAASGLGHWNLTGAVIYTTLEPCVMCAGALVLARIKEVIFAAEDNKGGAHSLAIPILAHPALNHAVMVRQGPLGEEASLLLKKFFQKKRREKIDAE